MSVLSFFEKVLIVNGNPYVRPPDQILEQLFLKSKKMTSPIPIKGKLNGAPFQQTLVRYNNDWRLYINAMMAKAARIPFTKSVTEIVGREVSIELSFDTHPPRYEMLSFLEDELNNYAAAKANWEKLPASRQKEILRYLAALKSDEAKKRNLAKVIDALSGEEVRFMARSWKGGK